MPRIYVLSGPDLGRTFDVAAGATFGRTAECAVVLRDVSVSRTHARLEQEGATWRVVDAGSRNGLFVGAERVPEARLDDGDEFRLGEVVLRFRADGAAAAATPAVAPAPEIRFHSGGAARAEIEPVESADIELEGDWSQPPAAPIAPPARVAPQPAPERAVPVAAPRSIASDERARKLAAAGVATGARPADARGILQYSKVEQREGVLRQELDQQPTWIRWAVVVVVAVVVVALAWVGYQAATATKARLAPAEQVEEEAR